MPKRPQIEVSKEDLLRAEIPMNHVLVQVVWRAEGAKSKGGIVIGFNEDDVYAEGDNSWSADLAEIYGIVTKVPNKLYFNPEDTAHSMDWETEMELCIDDLVWYSVLEAKNSVQILCDGVLYKSIPYSDCYVAKRTKTQENITHKKSGIGFNADFVFVIPLNGYVLCRPINPPKQGHLDVISDTIYDKSRGIVSFIGKPVKSYLNASYSHIDDLRVGDEVLFDKKCPLFMLERNKSIACFDGDNQYWVVAHRRIALVLKRENNG